METLVSEMESHNGHHHGFVTLPKELAQYPEMLAVLMQEQRLTEQGRSQAIERQAQASRRWAYWLGGMLTMFTLLIAWLVWQQRDVQPMVQVVQLTEEGRLLQVGHPVKALEFTPEEGQWAEMLGEWLLRVHWRGKDANKEERHDRRWVELHTCPSARGQLLSLLALRHEEKKDRKKYEETTIAVDIDTTTMTPTPNSYQVLWAKVMTSPDFPQGKTFWYTTTFTVDRVRFTRQADIQQNFLGLCVASFSTDDSKLNPTLRKH